MAYTDYDRNWDPDLTQIRSFARETAGVSLPPAPSPTDDTWSFQSPSANSPSPPPMAQGSRASMDAYMSGFLGSTGASQRTLHPGDMYGSEQFGWPNDDLQSPDARNMYSEGEGFTGEDDDEGGKTKKKPAIMENWKPAKRRIPKVPWDPYLFKMADLKGNSEQCRCGYVFLEIDEFCYRCGNRRPVDVKPLPLHVDRLPTPAIDNVCERLYAWAHGYRQRKEDLRELKQANIESAASQEHPGTPAINPLSSDLAQNLKPIHERYKGIMWMKEFSLQRDREKQATEEVKHYTWAPEIHPKSRNLDRGLTSLYRWKKKIESRNEVMRQRKAELETVTLTFTPTVGPTSRRLAAKQDPDKSGQTVHDRLYVDAQTRRFAQDMEQKAAAQRFAARTRSGGKSGGSQTSRGGGSSRESSPRGGNALKKSASARSLPSAPPPASQVIKGLNAERGRGGKLGNSASTPSLDGRVRRGQTPNDSPPTTPRSLRGPRASMAVLPKKDSEQESSRRKKWKKARLGQGSGHGHHMSMAEGKMTVAFGGEEVDEDEYEMPRSVWTGGANTITIEAPFQDLLSQCAPDPPVDAAAIRRGR